MKITSLNLELGVEMKLGKGEMRSLGDLVVLAGPNGAGKSRILKTVLYVLENPNLHAPQLENYRSALANAELNPRPENEGTRHTWKGIVHRASLFRAEGEYRPGLGVEFFPKETTLDDHRQMNEAAQREAVDSTKSQSVSAFNRLTLPYLAMIERRAFAATHPARTGKEKESENEEACRSRDRLDELCREILGTTIELDIDGQPSLFGKPIADAKLSEGQRILLQVIALLHARASTLGDLVLLLDEPESHLHPAALVQTINRMRAANPRGQIWIATHCVPVLASVPTDAIWYVKDGVVSWAGRRPEIVLEGLLGGAESREKMEEFLRLPAQFASNQFAAECLISPKPASSRPGDPQAAQVREFCAAAISESEPLKVVDFGAGEGRLLSAMYESWEGDRPFSEALDYRAFEPFPDDANTLLGTVSSVYPGQSETRVYSSYDKLPMIDANSVDVVVMCNVLHEVPPQEWKDLFGANGAIAKMLKPTGRLLILEDMEMPHGEKAHRFGFLLLDEAQLYQLLACTERDPEKILSVSTRTGRLKAHSVPAALLGRTTHESTIAALENLLERARREIHRLRAEGVHSRSGRLHALWTQLLANADLGVRVLK